MEGDVDRCCVDNNPRCLVTRMGEVETIRRCYKFVQPLGDEQKGGIPPANRAVTGPLVVTGPFELGYEKM